MSHRPRERVRHLLAAVCAVVVVAAGLFAGGQGAAAAGRSVAHAHVRRTATAHAHARVSRSATATRAVSVAGHTASATARGDAAVRAVASATASRRARATAHSTDTRHARALARRRAAHRARLRATAAARAAALTRARRSAAAQALAQASARAGAAAVAQATRAATELANRHSSGANPPGQLTGGNAPVTTTVGAASGGTTPPVTAGGNTVGVAVGGTDVGVGPCGGQAPAKAGGGSWTCSFDDEFAGAGLDTSKWSVQQTAASGFTQGGACYVANPNNVSVSGGTLNLTVRREAGPFTCPSPAGSFSTAYSAGEVTTLGTFNQAYGRFEVRAQLPPATAAGLQETFWLWPLDDMKYGPWPTSGELDFAEFYSRYPGWLIPYFHYDYDASTTSWASNTNVVTAWPAPYSQPGTTCRFDQSTFNTYTFSWQPNRLTVQVNGQDCLVDNYVSDDLAGAAPFDQPFFLALTQALGVGANAPTADTGLPATTRIDYVRAWS